MVDYRKILATNIREARKLRGLSQEALADGAGIDRTYVSGIERATRNPSLNLIIKLAACLKCEPSELLKVDPYFKSAALQEQK